MRGRPQPFAAMPQPATATKDIEPSPAYERNLCAVRARRLRIQIASPVRLSAATEIPMSDISTRPGVPSSRPE
ncbi:hypothetical protein D3C86_2105870 [compost metagenome]